MIPAIIGVYVADSAINIAMELPDNSFWFEATNDMPDDLKEQCVLAFDKIHSRGVLHNDVALRHMLIGSKGNVVIIDFQKSQVLPGDDTFGIEDCSQADIRLEKRKVKFQLDYQGAVAKENIWRNHYAEMDPETRLNSKEYSLDPIIDGPEWRTEWLDNGFESSCFILPGQDVKEVQNSLKHFSAREYYQWQVIPSSESALPPCPSAPGYSPIVVPNVPKRKRSCDQTDTHTTPVKRQRQETNHPPSPSTDSRSSQPPQKINRYYEDLKDEIMASRLSVLGSVGDTATLPHSSFSTESTQPSIDVATQSLTEGSSEPAEAVHVGSGLDVEESIPPGVYSEEQLVMLRRLWILQETLVKCKEEGVVYPLATRLALTPSTDPSGDSRKQPDGRMLEVSVGKLVRNRKRDEQDPAAIRGEVYSRKHTYRTAPYPARKQIIAKFDETFPNPATRSGPEIVSPAQLRNIRPKDKGPPRGILRRRLTEKEKQEQQEFEASLTKPVGLYFLADGSGSDVEISDEESTTATDDETATGVFIWSIHAHIIVSSQVVCFFRAKYIPASFRCFEGSASGHLTSTSIIPIQRGLQSPPATTF